MKKMLLGVSTAMVLALAACGGPTQLTPAQAQTAQMGALQYSQMAGQDSVGCSGQDSNNDGYVTCTIKNRTTGALTEIVCSYEGAPGCKLKVAAVDLHDPNLLASL